MKCPVCKRRLTSPESIRSGAGKICRRRMGSATRAPAVHGLSRRPDGTRRYLVGRYTVTLGAGVSDCDCELLKRVIWCRHIDAVLAKLEGKLEAAV